MICRIACVLAVFTPLIAAEPAADAKKGPADLQGAWTLDSVETEAGTIDLPDQPATLVIRGDRLIYGGEEIGRLAADAATDPKVIDLTFGKAERAYEGIYAVVKDSLKICLNGRTESVKERPDSFSLKDHPAWRLLAFRRAKDGEKDAGIGYISVALSLDDDRKEVVVNDALEDGPAKAAGLRKDDVLLEIAGTKISDLRSAVEAARGAKPRSELTVRFRRGDKEDTLKVKVGLLPVGILLGLH